MLSFHVKRIPIKQSDADAVVYFIFEDKNSGAEVFKSQVAFLQSNFASITPALQARLFTGKFQETLTLFPSELKARLLLVGLGTPEKLTVERLRRAAATAAKTAATLKAQTLAFVEPDPQTLSSLEWGNDWETIGCALAEGVGLSLYKFRKYFTDKEKKNPTVRRLDLLCDDVARTKPMKKGVAYARLVTEASYLARDLANEPANEIFPESLARHAQRAGRRYGFRVTVLNERQIRRLKMGGLLAVAKGSEQPPRFIIMEYKPKRRPASTIVLVGKGVTFDAGGISIKPAAGMGEMKMDMAGGAAVIATMGVAARLQLPIRLIGLVPAVENLLGGAAMKPGDVIVHLNGKTTEVDNTDAEGRLILADALSYASRYKPNVVIDLATLTGHVIVGLGHHATGMMGNDQSVMDALREAGERTYERVWQLPLFEEYEKQIKSDIADVRNSGGRPAGAITAALFLKQFIGDYPWVHLDIAGTAMLSESLDYFPRGASGVGVRLLSEFLRTWGKR
jgi:leucyl aminopeptidase